jgi:hypothetical protein
VVAGESPARWRAQSHFPHKAFSRREHDREAIFPISTLTCLLFGRHETLLDQALPEVGDALADLLVRLVHVLADVLGLVGAVGEDVHAEGLVVAVLGYAKLPKGVVRGVELARVQGGHELGGVEGGAVHGALALLVVPTLGDGVDVG